MQLLPVARLGAYQFGGQVAAGRQVQHDGLARLPVARYLQDGGAGQAPVGKQQVFQERRAPLALPGRQRDFQGDARQRGERLPLRGIEGQRHQGRPRLDDLQAELARHLERVVGRAQLRDRHAAGGYHDRARVDRAGAGTQREAAALAAGDLVHAARHAPGHPALPALGAQHLDDGFAAVVAEQLPAMLFMPMHPMAAQQAEEILRGVAGQRRAAEMRVVGQEIGRAGAQVGEVAAPSAGDADFLGQLGGMIDQHHAQAALARHGGAHHAGSPGADDGDIEHRNGILPRRQRRAGPPPRAARRVGFTARRRPSGSRRNSAWRHRGPLRRPGRGCRSRSRGSAR
ncbi:Uncharacterised protein [Bordetella pertussis]|nr:Uncharacterised protein [Bordetella pertussis]